MIAHLRAIDCQLEKQRSLTPPPFLTMFFVGVGELRTKSAETFNSRVHASPSVFGESRSMMKNKVINLGLILENDRVVLVVVVIITIMIGRHLCHCAHQIHTIKTIST